MGENQNELFEEFIKEFSTMLDSEKKSFDEMSNAFNKCKEFYENIAKQKSWTLDDKQKEEEEDELNKKFKESINKWQEAHEKRVNYLNKTKQ